MLSMEQWLGSTKGEKKWYGVEMTESQMAKLLPHLNNQFGTATPKSIVNLHSFKGEETRQHMDIYLTPAEFDILNDKLILQVM